MISMNDSSSDAAEYEFTNASLPVTADHQQVRRTGARLVEQRLSLLTSQAINVAQRGGDALAREVGGNVCTRMLAVPPGTRLCVDGGDRHLVGRFNQRHRVGQCTSSFTLGVPADQNVAAD